MTIKPENVEVDVGQSAKFECRANGNPPPEIVWSRGGVKGNVLPFEAVTLSDEGWYNCSADNGVGPPVIVSAYLDVIG